MQTQSARLVGGFALLAAVWVVTYWAWGPTEPKISFAMVPEQVDPPADSLKAEGATGIASPMGPPAIPEEPAVIPPEFMAYVILPGDTLASISAKHFKDVGYADAIAQANPMMDPTRLKLGRTIRIPRDPKNVQGIPNLLHPTPAAVVGAFTEYTVEKNDSLTSISKRFYGTIKHADLIFAENKSILASKDALKIGQVLRIPPKPTDGNQ